MAFSKLPRSTMLGRLAISAIFCCSCLYLKLVPSRLLMQTSILWSKLPFCRVRSILSNCASGFLGFYWLWNMQSLKSSSILSQSKKFEYLHRVLILVFNLLHAVTNKIVQLRNYFRCGDRDQIARNEQFMLVFQFRLTVVLEELVPFNKTRTWIRNRK